MADRGTSTRVTPRGVIDLGLIGPERSTVDYGARMHRPPPWFATLVIATLAAAALTAGGSLAPAVGPGFAIERVTGPIRLTGDTLYAMVGGGRDATLNAYRLDSGALRWQYRPDGRAVVWPQQPDAEVILVAPATCATPDAFETVGVDVSTGRPRWRVVGAPVLGVSGSAVVVFKRPVDGCAETGLGIDASPTASFVWSGVDVATGAVLWSLPVATGSKLSIGYDDVGAGRWFAVDAIGSITVYDLRTGATHNVLRLAEPASARLLAAGAQAVLLQRRHGVFSLTTSDAASSGTQWTAEIPRPETVGLADLDVFTAARCGPTVCLGSVAHTIGLDPLTGAERWRVDGHLVVAGAALGVFRQPARYGGAPELVVHDLFGGAQRLVLSGWQLVGAGAGPLTDAAVLVASSAGAQTWVWSVGLNTGRLALLGAVPARELSQCAALVRYLACESREGSVRAWRLA